MNIVQPYAKIINFPCDLFEYKDGLDLLKKIEWCARISHRSEDKVTAESYSRFVRFVVMEKGDWSVTEHASVTCDFLVDRGITHEIVRHRLFSFTQESTRFCNYGKKDGQISVISPLNYLDTSTEIEESNNYSIWERGIFDAETSYLQLLDKKVSPQIARGVLPNSLASRIIITGNLRNWRHFFLMRTSKEAHPQMREVTIPLLKEFQEKIPILYEDIIPESRQIDNMRLPR